ncbi:GNAT family N-acetyltransferase [Spirillospora sp. NPDC029432]|uniref:GNAT family N-acetyltransferase n=1 Tax=Spirillospora sp. NPDC029432 TaxID=3154599 RepID=UPI0034548D30
MPDLIQLTDRSDVTAPLRRGLINCWTDVARHDGGPSRKNIAPVLDTLLTRLHPERERLFAALSGAALVGWATLARDDNPLIDHWGRVCYLQTHPSYRKRGVATALMRRLQRTAREQMGLERLQLATCGGHGLENFYDRLGWHETGRWPRDGHEEVLMVMAPL